MTPDELAHLRELHEKASPAPWEEVPAEQSPTGDWELPYIIGSSGEEVAVDINFTGENLPLILEARNALPDLLNHIDRLTRRLEIYEARLGRVARNHPDAHAEALAGDTQ